MMRVCGNHRRWYLKPNMEHNCKKSGLRMSVRVNWAKSSPSLAAVPPSSCNAKRWLLFGRWEGPFCHGLPYKAPRMIQHYSTSSLVLLCFNVYKWYNVNCEDCPRSALKFRGILYCLQEKPACRLTRGCAWICRQGTKRPDRGPATLSPNMQWVAELEI